MVAIFARIAVATFGSGNTTTALLGEEFIERRQWLRREQYALSFALARATPGTNLLGFCTAIGWFMRGWIGGLAALTAVSAPAGVVVVLLTLAYQTWHTHPLGNAAITAAMASIVGVIAAGAWLLVRPHLDRANAYRTTTIVLGALICSLVFEIAPVRVIAAAAIVGYLWPERERA